MGKEISMEELIGALRRMAAETGFLICLDMLESRPTVDAVEVVRFLEAEDGIYFKGYGYIEAFDPEKDYHV